MTNFVRDDTPIPGPKTQWDGVSDEAAEPDMFENSSDYNTIRDALVDLRDWIQTGLAAGVYTAVTLTVDSDGRITAIASGAGITDGDKGDVTVSVGGTVWTVDALPESRITNLVADLGTLTAAIAAEATLARSATNLTSGTIPAARIGAHSVTAAMQTQMATLTVKGNSTGGTADESDLSMSTLLGMLGLGGTGGYGDQSDGDAVMDGATAVAGHALASSTYTAQRICNFGRVTGSNAVFWRPAGFPMFLDIEIVGPASGTFTVTVSGNNGVGGDVDPGTGGPGGAIAYGTPSLLPGLTTAAPAGGNNQAVGNTAGASTNAPREFASGFAAGGAAPASNNVGNPGTAGGKGQGGGGGSCGATTSSPGVAGGNGGNVARELNTNGDFRLMVSWMTGRNLGGTQYTPGTHGAGGAGCALAGGGGGGGGGSGAGQAVMACRHFGANVANISFLAKGGDGGAGRKASSTPVTGTGGTGGGGGGSGGIWGWITAETPPTANINGGAGGAGQPGNGINLLAGAAGGNGGVGMVITQKPA